MGGNVCPEHTETEHTHTHNSLSCAIRVCKGTDALLEMVSQCVSQAFLCFGEDCHLFLNV